MVSKFSNPVSSILDACKVRDYTSEYARDIKANPHRVQNCIAVFQRASELIKAYEGLLTFETLAMAKTMCWSCTSVSDYERSFLRNVLLNYRMWEMSPEALKARYKLIAAKNEAWGIRFLKDATEKCSKSRCELVRAMEPAIEKMYEEELARMNAMRGENARVS